MALERQKTIKVNLTKPIDSEIEEFLKNNETSKGKHAI